jgi:hypothetical protein|tara:strand:+ start:1132 stop:1791 length:660 start_codon:yes stop_codon:yes gene_type:complete
MKQKKRVIKKELAKKHFRVTIFGSARIKKGDTRFNQVKSLAKMLGEKGIDIVTGGGPGLMQAASIGHNLGMKISKKESHSIGLLIKLPREQKTAEFLNIKKEFSKFSNRLDDFMELSNVFVVAPGGIGTTLELFYTLQLIQVKQTCNVPVILLGNMWAPLIKWLEKYPIKNKLMNKEDLNSVFLAKNSEEAMKMINKAYEHHKKGDKNICLNYKRYKLY